MFVVLLILDGRSAKQPQIVADNSSFVPTVLQAVRWVVGSSSGLIASRLPLLGAQVLHFLVSGVPAGDTSLALAPAIPQILEMG